MQKHDMRNRELLLIIDETRRGVENMAIDIALARAVGKEYLPLTVRLYGWLKPTLSLGKLQKLDDVNLEYLKKEGIDIVRRPTGGTAVLHEDEITYCFCLPGTSPWGKYRSQKIYLEISRLLCTSLRMLGIPAEIHEKTEYRRSAACYATTSKFEITLFGRKLVGSAQYRTRGFVLQHGSIPLKLDLERYIHCFKNPDFSIRNRIITLSEIGKNVEKEELAMSIKAAAEKLLNVDVKISRELPPLIFEQMKCVEDFHIPVNE